MMQEREVLSELAEQKVLRAAYSERQLEEVMVDFWFNHFNVFAGKGPTRDLLTEYERDAIRPHVLGRFRDLLGATATEPGDALLPRQLAERRPDGRTRRPMNGSAVGRGTPARTPRLTPRRRATQAAERRRAA